MTSRPARNGFQQVSSTEDDTTPIKSETTSSTSEFEFETPPKKNFFMYSLLLALFTFSSIIIIQSIHTSSKSSPSMRTPDKFPTNYDKYRVIAPPNTGVVATDVPYCSSLSAEVLKAGGNAVEAAITASLCVGIISPVASGIGGGFFMLYYDSKFKNATFIDSRETSPIYSDPHMFEGRPKAAQYGPLAIATMGEVKGLETAFNLYKSGNVTWKSLVLPVAHLAKEWKISQNLEYYLDMDETKDFIINKYSPLLSALYLRSDGNVKRAGDIVRQPELSRTLEMIAEYGSAYLYDTMASTIAKEIQDAGGIITDEDIRTFAPNITTPVKGDIAGYTYYGASGSSSGGSAVLGILQYMFSYTDPLVSQGFLYYHRLIESMKHIFAVRMSLADSRFINDAEARYAINNIDYITSLRDSSADTHILPKDHYGGKFNATFAQLIDSGTTHISIIDSNGNSVSLTSTINTYFGSRFISPSTGILFNNQMDDFSIPGSPNFFGLLPSPINHPYPKKRPLSSMSPSILVNKSNGKVRLIGGASGGPMIITATAQVILNHIGRGLDILSSIVAPRIHAQLYPQNYNLFVSDNQEFGWCNPIRLASDLRYFLSLRGQFSEASYKSTTGITQFISIDPDTEEVIGVSDPRKNGGPAMAL